MSQKTRIKKLEQESSRHKKALICVGIIYKDGTVDPASEKSYQEYLQAHIEEPFIWIKMMRPINKTDMEAISENKEPN